MKNYQILFLTLILFIQCGCSAAENFKVMRQLSGPGETNTYLIYDLKSGEAAIVDPGWSPDTLLDFIKKNDLKLKYIFVTHGHTDHIFGVPAIKQQFPKVQLCLEKHEYENMFTLFQWITETFGQAVVDNQKSNPATKPYIEFDPKTIGTPEIFAEDGQTYKLGSLEIKTMLTPGHAPGEISYYTGNILFSGDVLFYRTVGGFRFQDSSKEELVKSVRKFYKTFPDSTIVYPGHGDFTDIGSEKRENDNITLEKENL
jgi:hydroxyacylglutathione hydrolase